MSDKLGYRIVLLGISNLKNNKVMQRVHPCMIPTIQCWQKLITNLIQ